MRIKVGGYEVLDDGTIVGNENDPIDFMFDEDIGFIIRFIFINDTTNQEHKVTAESFDKRGALLRFINFNNSLGIGNTAPIEIGTMNHRKLYLNYRVYALERGGKTVHYTWLLGKEVIND